MLEVMPTTKCNDIYSVSFVEEEKAVGNVSFRLVHNERNGLNTKVSITSAEFIGCTCQSQTLNLMGILERHAWEAAAEALGQPAGRYVVWEGDASQLFIRHHINQYTK